MISPEFTTFGEVNTLPPAQPGWEWVSYDEFKLQTRTVFEQVFNEPADPDFLEMACDATIAGSCHSAYLDGILFVMMESSPQLAK